MARSIGDTYEILNQIGRGSYASVYKAINRVTGEICAIKKISIKFHSLASLMNEIGILSNCDCKNIVRFLASDCYDSEVSIVMEYCSGGSVKDVMRHLRCTLNQDQLTVIVKDVLNGLDYIHSKMKIHRDIKGANILLTEEGVAKIADFGVSEPLDPSSKDRPLIGTLLWVPPEVFNEQEGYHDPKIDIWSLGITIIEMADGQPPHSDLKDPVAAIKNLNKPSPTFKDTSAWSQDLVEFLALCLEKDPTRRRSAKELSHHKALLDCSSNGAVRDLVAKVCSSLPSSKEMETKLHRRSECLLKESVILFDIYKKRRMKVIKVDQMTVSLNSAQKEFKDLMDQMMQRSARLDEIGSQSGAILNEISKLERERNDLRSILDGHKKRKLDIMEQLNKIKEKQKRIENDEFQRKLKLRKLREKFN